MTNKVKTRLCSLALIMLSLVFINGCKKSTDASINILLPEVASINVSGVTLDSAFCSGTVSADGGAVLSPRGFCYSISPNPTIADSSVLAGTGMGNFTAYLRDLTAGTTYHVRAYASNSAGVTYGSDLTFTTESLALGANYHGGKIAYLNGLHGLIAAANDSIGKTWYNGMDTVTHAIGTGIGSGAANTDSIIVNQGSGTYAAMVCGKLVINGYTDWYLPSKDELNELYTNRVIVGGFDPVATYWTSSETDVSNAWSQFFGDGSQAIQPKLSTFNVRPVRSF